MDITIYTLAYNEELMIPHFITHYRKQFPNCKIVVFDNESTDNTRKIALENDCKVISYNTNNRLSDNTYLQIKNNCWKESETDWSIVCDMDEFCQISNDELEYENSIGTTIFKFEGYDMVNTSTDYNSTEVKINTGVKNHRYDKTLLINKKHIVDINFEVGCHGAYPTGNVRYSSKPYRLYHYRYIGKKYLIDRYREYNNRLSDDNRIKRWGIEYTQEEIQTIQFFDDLIKKSTKLFDFE
jgi:glycosyltransferase involved in cell wall biosynthesis